MIISSLLNIIPEMLIINHKKYEAKWLLRILNFGFSFDKDVIIKSFKVMQEVYTLSHISCATNAQQEILLKLAELDYKMNDLLPFLDNKKYTPIEDLK